MAAPQVTELVTKFSFAGSTAPLEKYNKGLGSSIALLGAVVTATVASAAAFAKWSSSILQSLDPLIQLNRNTGVSIERIQELSFAASQFGSDAGAVQGTIDSLSNSIGNAALFGSDEFSRLGISVRDTNGNLKNAAQILGEVQGAFGRLGLSQIEQRTLASSLGIDPSLIQMLNATSGEMAELTTKAREMGVLTKEQSETTENYNNSLATMRFALDAVKQQMAVAVAPELQELTKSFTEALVESKDFLIEGVEALTKGFKIMVESLKRTLPVLAILGGVFLAVKIYAIGLAGVMAIITAPIIVWTAALAAAYLVVDDLIVAFKGGKSVINEFFKEFLGVDLTDITQMMEDLIDSVGYLLNGEFKMAWESFKAYAEGAFKFVTELFKGIGKSIMPQEIGGMTTSFGLASRASEFFAEDFNRSRNFFNSLFGGGGDSNWEPVPLIPAPGDNTGGGGGRGDINMFNNFDIRGDNPERIGQSVNETLQRQLRDAQSETGGGSRSDQRGGM